VTGFILNGWNNIVENNTAKTYGVSFAATPSMKWSYTINYLAGPEEAAGAFGFTSAALTTPVSVNGAWRQTWDAVGTYTPNAKWSFMVNLDYGRGDRIATSPNAVNPSLSFPVSWFGGAGYAKYAPDANDYFAVRYEYYEDYNGFTATSSIPGFSTGVGPYTFLTTNAFGNIDRLHFHEVTATYQRTLSSYFLARFEYRRDMSQFPVYAISTFGPGINHQDTLSMGLIFLFDSRYAK